MSAAPYTKIANSRNTAAVAARARTTGRSTPRVRIKSRVASQNSTSVYALRKLSVFGTFMCLGFMLSTVTGQVMLEKSRNDGKRSLQLASEARKGEYAIRKQVDALMSTTAVEEWAMAHGFIAPDAQVEPKEITQLGPVKD